MAELAVSTERHEITSAEAPPPSPSWLCWAMPSVADFVFLAIFVTLTFTAFSNSLLHDAGTGWHIRNGDHILATHAVPRSDYFSYTAAGRPWYAWEWLYDIGIAAIHRLAGLNGVVVLTALVVALTFAWLFRATFKASGNLPISALLVLLSAASASIHFLARPHVFTWLFTLLFLLILRATQEGKGRPAYWLPAVMVLWVNLHGGFIVGVVLICIFAVANVCTYATAACPTKRSHSATLGKTFAVTAACSALVTLINPYGIRLWTHLYEYLGSSFLMTNISEFQSPNFHWLQTKFFAALVLISIAVMAVNATKVRILDVLLVLFAVYAGIYAARNIPISAIILTLTIAPLASKSLSDAVEEKALSLSSRRRLGSFNTFSSRMGAVETSLRGHVLPIISVALAIAAVLHHGSIASRQLIEARWDEKRMPVAATDFLQEQGIRDHFFSPDDWGGYLIYRMYPNLHVFMDDRHDFYGEAFVRDYLKVAKADPQWAAVLDGQSVNWVLTPSDSPLSSVLDASSGWKLLHSDATAKLYGRTTTNSRGVN